MIRVCYLFILVVSVFNTACFCMYLLSKQSGVKCSKWISMNKTMNYSFKFSESLENIQLKYLIWTMRQMNLITSTFYNKNKWCWCIVQACNQLLKLSLLHINVHSACSNEKCVLVFINIKFCIVWIYFHNHRFDGWKARQV